MRACVDRFENDKAVLVFEDAGESVTVPRELLPADCKEGDILSISIAVDKLETKRRLREIERLQQE